MSSGPALACGIDTAIRRTLNAATAATRAAHRDDAPEIHSAQRVELESYMEQPAVKARLKAAAAILADVQEGVRRKTDMDIDGVHYPGIGHEGIAQMLRWLL